MTKLRLDWLLALSPFVFLAACGGDPAADEAGVDTFDGSTPTPTGPTILPDGGVAACATPPCANGSGCTSNDQCSSGLCIQNGCVPATAADGQKNGTETDVDCGGDIAGAPRCADTKACLAGTDCVNGVCGSGVCQPPGPSDKVKNGDETDVDCGGATAPACATGKNCKVANDCSEKFCKDFVCTLPTKTDAVKNGNETGVDCGKGPTGFDTGAGLCPANQDCLQPSDCESGVCTGNKCQAPSFTDGVKNGDETDTDCGGPTAPADKKCAATKACIEHRDCASDGCGFDKKCAEAPSCAARYGGQTCGTGEVGEAGANHESCCRSLEVPGFTDANYAGKKVYLDKYEITAGRMREFITRMEAIGPGNQAMIATWLTGHMPKVWNDTRIDGATDPLTSWTHWLPQGSINVARELPRFNTYYSGTQPTGVNFGDVGTSRIFNIDGYYFYTHGHNCDRGTGYPTYWYAGDNRGLSQDLLDVKAMNCAPNAMLAAFCAWDGGQLATASVLQAVTGVTYANRGAMSGSYAAYQRLPAVTVGGVAPTAGVTLDCSNPDPTQRPNGCPLVNYSNDAGQPLFYPEAPYFYDPVAGGSNETAARVMPPGRRNTDATRITAGTEPWMDLRGNMQEVAIDDRAGQPVLQFTGTMYDGLGRASARDQRVTRGVFPEFKVATVGGRCMRFK